MDAIVALDQGSSSSRALAVGPGGRVLARAQVALRTHRPRPGFAEHDALELAAGQERALDQVLARLPGRVRVIGLGIACQRSTVVLWDRQTGKPAARALSWQDARAAEVTARLADRQAETHAKTGLYMTPYYSAPKIRWLLEREAGVRRLADSGRLMAAPVATFLLWRLSRGQTFAADPTTAQRMLLYGLDSGSWDEGLLSLFGVPRACLPAIRPTIGAWGSIRRGGREIPVLAVCGDQQAAAFGQGAREPGAAVLNYGTGAFLLLHAGTEARRVPGLLTSVAAEGGYFQEGTVHAAATSLEWLEQSLGLGRAREADALCRRSRERVWALPAIGGLGAPRWDYATPAAFFGLTGRTKAEDLVRATAEAVAYLVADVAHALRAAGYGFSSLAASGGLARVGHILQTQADLLQRPILRLKETEGTALGAAAMAAEAAGVPWAAGLGKPRAERTFAPRIPAEEAARRHAGWAAFVRAQQALAKELKGLGL